MRLAVVLMLFAITCGKTPPQPSVQTPPPQRQEQSGPRVVFPDGFVVRVEIAADDETRAQGLMFRDHLRPGTGMLFLFPQDGQYPFWMKNTKISLDMIWIDSGFRIAAIAHDVPPCYVDDCPSYPPNATARYVLEVAAGVAKQHGLKAGDRLKFEQTDRFVAR